jgi:DNA segregation ATPase FtsK/SpoIIIE, S-DNA-T family
MLLTAADRGENEMTSATRSAGSALAPSAGSKTSEPTQPMIHRPGEALTELVALSSERSVAETRVALELKDRTELAERTYLDARRNADLRRDAEKTRADESRDHQLADLTARADAALIAADKTSELATRKIKGRYASDVNNAKKTADDLKWEAQTIFDAARGDAKKRSEILARDLANQEKTLKEVHDAAQPIFEAYKKFAAQPATATPPDAPASDPITLASITERVAVADLALGKLEKLSLPKALRIDRYIGWVFLLAAILAGAFYPLLGLPLGPIVGAAIGLSIGGALRGWLVSVAKRQVSRHYHPLHRELDELVEGIKRFRQESAIAQANEDAATKAKRDDAITKAENRRASIQAEAELRRDQDLKTSRDEHQKTIAEIESRRQAERKATEDDHLRATAVLTQNHEDALGQADRQYQQYRGSILAAHERDWQTMADRWRTGFNRVRTEADDLGRETGQFSLDWSGANGGIDWTPALDVPPAIRVGEFRIVLADIPGGVPTDLTLRAEVPEALVFPALAPFPELGCLLLKAAGAGRQEAMRTLQASMLRLLTAVPPGKVRFTIVDPVGLGRNFAAFMHLADFEESLVSNRIWTEPHHIDRKLTDLTEVMENVIQKYLRNEYKTIQEYNAQAGEVAEPYRILVIADFPHSFTDSACKRLASIVEAGARCGVSVLMSVDTAEPMPGALKLADLERHATVVTWNRDRFVWKTKPLDQYPLKLDQPPAAELETEVLKAVGAAAKKALRVEVPFEVIAPADGQWWTGTTTGGVDVPLGRAGATRLQHLALGKGTSQHVLIAGRTGSGKSTLLHALITNLALTYSPEEVELHLIDFKKGVEFKTYAAHELPHARVIAVESEREFGLSVLQRLDLEMKERGDLFRTVGAQDVGSYRRQKDVKPMPRILLIVDEFQEFFVEDDKVAQEASLLLDRLVRQGRAFGIHVTLGSQTLAGAYSLARSTLGQMGVRIALQCSESDAHLILSEDNAAARLLSRPGEAIYNDANGMVEGNHVFQVVWLPDDRREIYLKRIHALAGERGLLPKTPAIVFEGNVPADMARNPLLAALMASPTWPEPARAPRAWLGEAVAIKDPTASVFRPQGGSHLLVVGQNDEGALSMFMIATLSLAAQRPPGAVKFYLGDGSQIDSPLAGRLGKLADVLPHSVRAFGPRELAGVLNEIAEEVTNRQSMEAVPPEDVYLVLYDLSRFRDLRKSDDDFGSFGRFGSSEPAAPSPSKQFGAILRDGPALGVHVLIWCDTYNNLNRALERADLREFEMRVLFQMSQADSSNLIDSPVASRLGFHRAYFHSEEQGSLEKFRPYGLPDDVWLEEIKAGFHSRPPASPVEA